MNFLRQCSYSQDFLALRNSLMTFVTQTYEGKNLSMKAKIVSCNYYDLDK